MTSPARRAQSKAATAERVNAPADTSPLTAAVVDLTAIRANVQALKRRAGDALLQVVVKANAYGHGAVPVALAALEAGADWLGVYAPAEGVALREAGITAPILVFGPFTITGAESMVAHGLTPTLTSLEGAALLQAAASGRTAHFHLKIDTGLSRAGIPAGDAIPFLRAIARFPDLQPQGIYTHFASADEPDKSLTIRQLHALLAADRALREADMSVPLRHAANSAATLDLPETHLDMVRCGIATYGIYPSADVSREVAFTPAMRLLSTLTRVHTVPAGAGVGYGHEHQCRAESVIGLAPIGYGDGLLRSLGNGNGRVLVRGMSAPIVGRVSMDQITIDLTAVPSARPGDRVTLIGEDIAQIQTADDLAAQAGTIGYDVVTKLLPRVPRVYVDRAASAAPRAPRSLG